MDSEISRILKEMNDEKALISEPFSEQVKHLSGLSSAKEFAALQDLSAATQAKELLDAFNNTPTSAMPYLMPTRMPRIPDFEETNHFQSAGVMLRRLADSIRVWRTDLPENMQPGVIALLSGGVQIEVESLAQESFHGIRVAGKLDGTDCVVLAHQATLQILCIAQPVVPPAAPKRPIGFIIDGQSSSA